MVMPLEELKNACKEIREEHDVPGLAAVAVRGDEIILKIADGRRAVEEGVAIDLNDKWHLGSLTKAMTATLVARMVEDGVLAWDSILVELLSHRSGIADALMTPEWLNQARTNPQSPLEQRQELLQQFREGSLPRLQAGDFNYSNLGYILAGAMLEEATGESWEELMKKYVFEPLGMHSTGFGAPGSKDLVDQPKGHHYHQGSWVSIPPGLEADNPVVMGPAASVHSTLEDYSKFMAMHMAGARGQSSLLNASSFSRLHTPIAGEGTAYSLGWVLVQNEGARSSLYHGGSNTLWAANVLINPAKNLGVLTVSNAFQKKPGPQYESAGYAATLKLLGLIMSHHDT